MLGTWLGTAEIVSFIWNELKTERSRVRVPARAIFFLNFAFDDDKDHGNTFKGSLTLAKHLFSSFKNANKHKFVSQWAYLPWLLGHYDYHQVPGAILSLISIG